jgi:hypothetical protein
MPGPDYYARVERRTRRAGACQLAPGSPNDPPSPYICCCYYCKSPRRPRPQSIRMAHFLPTCVHIPRRTQLSCRVCQMAFLRAQNFLASICVGHGTKLLASITLLSLGNTTPFLTSQHHSGLGSRRLHSVMMALKYRGARQDFTVRDVWSSNPSLAFQQLSKGPDCVTVQPHLATACRQVGATARPAPPITGHHPCEQEQQQYLVPSFVTMCGLEHATIIILRSKPFDPSLVSPSAPVLFSYRLPDLSTMWEHLQVERTRQYISET